MEFYQCLFMILTNWFKTARLIDITESTKHDKTRAEADGLDRISRILEVALLILLSLIEMVPRNLVRSGLEIKYHAHNSVAQVFLRKAIQVGSISVSSGEERGLLSRTAAGNRAYHTSFWTRIQMLFYRIPRYLYRISPIIYKEFSVISYTEYSPLFKQNFPWFQTRSYFSWVLSSVIYSRLFRTTVQPHKMSILDGGLWEMVRVVHIMPA